MAVTEWIVEIEAHGTRLDHFLARHLSDFSRAAAVKALRDGFVKINGEPAAKPGSTIKAGDRIVFEHPPTIESTARAEAIPLIIVYEDDDLAVIDKPAGMVTHPAAGHHSGTLVNALLHHLKDLSGVGGVKRPGIVHRLDKETSGLMMVAKNDRAHIALSEKIKARTVTRIYDAVVWGCLEDTNLTVATQMGRDPKERKRFSVVAEGGKHAVTHFTRLRLFEHFTLLSAKLETGRTHQIRVHCRYMGHPVAGDKMYGRRNEKSQLGQWDLEQPSRHLLHARSLNFLHPFTGKEMSFQSTWPEDFKKFVESLV